LEDASDALLVERARLGNAVAFEALVRRYQGAVYGAAFAAIGDADAARDAAQEAFLVAWRSLGRLREVARLRAWLCGVARNVAVSEVRRRARGGVPIQSAPEPATADPTLARAEAEARVADLAAMRAAMADLTEQQRAVLCLRYFDGLAYKAIAEALGVTVDVVQVTLFRAKRALGKKLGKKPGPGATSS
jgi:RNA polymerase sigma-70 factor (ECF subfamily)